MSIVKKKVNTSIGLQHIAAITSTTAISGGYTGNIEEIHSIKQGEPVDAEKLLKILQDLVTNDVSIDAQAATFYPLLSEGVLPIRSAQNFKLTTNDIVTTLLNEITLANPTTSIKINAAGCRVKIKTAIIETPGDQDFVTVAPGIGQIQIPALATTNYHRTVLLQMDVNGVYNLKFIGSEVALKPNHASRLNEDANSYGLYSFILKKIGADTKIISIKKIFDLAGFNNFFLRNIVPWHRSKEYDNVFRLFLDEARHLRKENFDLLTEDYATTFDNSGSEVDVTDLVYYNNDASTGQAKFKFDTNIFPEVLEPNHNIYSFPGNALNGSGIYHYIVPGDQASAAIPFPEYASPTYGLRSAGWLYYSKVANAGAFQEAAKIKSLTLALHKSPGVPFDDNIKVAIVNLPRFIQNTNGLEQFNVVSTSVPVIGIAEIVCNDVGVNFNGASVWSTDYPAFVNTQLNVGDIIFFTSGANAGFSSPITSIVNGTTLRFEVLSNAVSAGDDFIIFKNVPITSPYVAGEVEYDVTYINGEQVIANGAGTNLVSTTAGTNNYFKIKKDNLAINIFKNKYYFILSKVNVADDDVVLNVPLLLVNNNATNIGNGNVRNIFYSITYFPSVGFYPSANFSLYDQYGEISSTNASRLVTWSGFLDKWDIIPADLNDTEIDIMANAGWITISGQQCFVDLSRGVVVFHPDYSPMSLYASYRIESFVGAETNSMEIRRQGTFSSIEDWMNDKFPDGVDSGLLYTKKRIASRDNRPITIPAGYTAFMAEDAILFGNLNIEENAELVVLNKRQLSFLLGITEGLTPGWDEQIIEGVGTLQYPQFKTYTLNSEVVRITYTYNVDDNPLTKTYEYSKDNASTWSLIGIKNFVYSGLYLTNTYWT